MFSTTYDTLEYLLLRARMFIIETQRRVTTREETNEHLGVDFRSFPKLRFRWWPCDVDHSWLLSKSLIHFLFADFDSGVNHHFRQDFWQFSAMQNCNTRRKGDWCLFVSPVCNYWYLAVNRIDFQFLELSSFIIKLNRLDWPVRWVIIFRFSPL